MTSTYWLDGSATGLLLADSLEHLLAAIIPDYINLTEEVDRAEARREFIIGWASDLQAGFLRTGLERGEFSWAGLTDDGGVTA
jgi:hypothetical protein